MNPQCENPQREYRWDNLNLDVDVVDWNGECCGWRTAYRCIGSYKGEQLVRELSCAPEEIFEPDKSPRQALIARGHRFERLRGVHVKLYRGIQEETLQFGQTWWKESHKASNYVIMSQVYLPCLAFRKSCPRHCFLLPIRRRV